ncbi:MAG TPA: 5'-3' exonuclease H3TH domain-containing protein [Dehalococcoidia bacterium]|nr:5'-3' exonuclease H3TH domain-containing protein [Dehalococcoidia bacterium]
MLLLLDGNNLAWAGYYALERAMKPEDDERRARVAALGLAGGVLGAIARRGEPPDSKTAPPLTRVALAFDEGRPLRRRKMYPPYQTGREGDPKFMTNEPTILRAIDGFAAAMAHAPVDILRGTNTEADDLIAGMAQAHPDLETRIVSTDRDFLQLVGPSLSVYAPVKRLIIDESNFFAEMAPRTSSGAPVLFPRERFLDYRTLIGDPSDNIAGVPGIGPLTAAKLLAEGPIERYYGNPQAVRDACGRKSAAVEAAFADGTAQRVAERNRALMDLRLPAPSWDQLDALTSRGTWDRARFEPWFDEQRITSVQKDDLFAIFDELAAARR